MIPVNFYQCSLSGFFYGCAFLLISLSGFYTAYTVRRARIFRFKLCAVYLLPLFMAFSFFARGYSPADDCRAMVVLAFIFLCSILYFREIKEYMSREGYHQAVIGTYLKAVTDPVMTTDPDRKITYVNDAMRQLLQIDKDEYIFGKTFNEIIQFQREKGHRITLHRLCSKTGCEDNRFPCKFYEYGEIDGEYCVFNIVYSAIYNGEGKRVGTITIIRRLDLDIIEDEKIYKALSCNSLEEANRMLWPEGVPMLDDNCNIGLVNGN